MAIVAVEAVEALDRFRWLIRRMAGSIPGGQGHFDDLEGEGIAAVLEGAGEAPSLDQRWWARRIRRAMARYLTQARPRGEVLVPEVEPPEPPPQADPGLAPEALARFRALIAGPGPFRDSLLLVARMSAAGYRESDIAAATGISVRTVKRLRSQLRAAIRPDAPRPRRSGTIRSETGASRPGAAGRGSASAARRT